MSAEADKLRLEIANADKALAKLHARCQHLEPLQREIIQHQIKGVEGNVRTMRINLAAMQDHSDVPCPHCSTPMPRGFQFCRPCIWELPAKLYTRLKGAVGFHHHKLVSDSFLQDAMAAASSHLKQHSSAVL